MFHHLALFTPFLYVIFGEIIPSRSRKMRVKLKTIFFGLACVSLIALYGYSQRGSSGENSGRSSLGAAKMAAQARGAGVLVADIKEDNRQAKWKPQLGIGRKKSKSLDGAEIRPNANGGDVLKKELGIKLEETHRNQKNVANVKLKLEEVVKKAEPETPKKRKDFPDPISLKPQPNAAQGQAQGGQRQPIQPPRPQEAVRPPPPQPAVQRQPQPPAPGPAVVVPNPPQPQNANQPANVQQQVRDKIQNQPQQAQHALPGNQGNQQVNSGIGAGQTTTSVINLSVVCCGDRTNETLVMLKSATLLAKQKLHFYIFAEDELHAGIGQRLNSWPAAYRRKFNFNLYPITFPDGEDPNQWKKVFKMCATQRLFLPDLLTHVDSLLYVDTDILFIRPIDEIYSFFKKFNSTHMAALAPEHEVKNIGWYNRFARHPYYGETGMNSGVMLMNLTRMRSFGWSQKIVPYYHEYKLKITWGDQDLINILFHYFPEGLFKYECEWNYRPDHCMYSNNCHRTKDNGIAIIHGCRGVYHNEKQPAFRAIYDTFRDYVFGVDLEMGLIKPLTSLLTQPNLLNNYCAKAVLEPVTSTLKRYANQVTPIGNPV